MSKKLIIAVIIIFLLLAAGIIALTQEAEMFVDIFDSKPDFDFTADDSFLEIDDDVPPYRGYIYAKDVPEWVKPVRWFRSNSGGLAIEETSSRFAALRNEYALSVGFAQREELPDSLLPFYDDDKDHIEIRTHYKNGIQARTQWVFRDLRGNARLIAVFSEQEEKTGFAEIYNDDGFLSVEYNYYEDGRETRTDFKFAEGFLISASVHVLEDDNGKKEHILYYADSYLYNRSALLRAIERKFYAKEQLSFSEEPVRVVFPASVKDAVNEKFLTGVRYNALPDFFGVSLVDNDYRMVYVTDSRNRIVSQTLYDDDKVVFVITNTWNGDRIASSVKTEGDEVLQALYEYDSQGNRVKESNIKNGVLERVVRKEGKIDIEELYIDGVIALRATWEDGRMVSETRIRNN